MSNERELFEQYIKKEYPFLNLARSTTNADEYSSATVCGFWEFWKAGIATMQDDVRKDADDTLTTLASGIKCLPRFTFLSPKEGGVKKFQDISGNWIERHEVMKLIGTALGE